MAGKPGVKPMEFVENYIQTNGVKLHVVSTGPEGGTPVVLLHGFPEFWAGWRHQIPALAEAGFRVLAPDQRGYNLSDAPKGVRSYALTELVKDILGLLDAYGIEKVRLVGHDWGAAVAWTFASFYPERVEKLVILNVPHPAVMLKFLMGSPRQMLKSWYIGFFQIPGLPEWLLGRNDFAGAIAMLRASGNPATFRAADLEAYRQAYRNAGGLGGMINWYRALMRHRPAMPGNARLKMPVLVLWGKKDVALSYEMAEASMKFCADGKLVPMERATHWVQHDEAEKVIDELLAFLK
jgi:pimeloyl-ACP methyl ester carboxylesterase